MRLPSLSAIIGSAALGSAALAAPATAQDAYLRVVDVGAGLCVIALSPDGHSMVYDAGRGQSPCLDAVRELIPNHKIDLLVLSHSDSDHIGATRGILSENDVAVIIHPGDPRGPTLAPIRQAIAQEPNADIWNLKVRPVPFGTRFPVGSATATFVAGWSDGQKTRGTGEPTLTKKPAMRNNALSSVIRFEFAGHSVLLTGDTVGRPDSQDNTLCRYAERKMVNNAQTVPIKSDVLVGQHHGADNATANCFITAVQPQFVVFSAGHQHRHPRQSAADRLIANGVMPDHIFRTDRGDHEGGAGWKKEWVYGSLAGCNDGPRDDDVEIHLPSDPLMPVSVGYRTPSNGC
jgi:beta-lactamase superfamily II metal-dependent hydrolase